MGVHFWDNGHIGQCDKVCTGSTRNNQDASEINSTEEVYIIIHKYSNAFSLDNIAQNIFVIHYINSNTLMHSWNIALNIFFISSLYILVHIDFGEIHVSIYYMIYS